MKYSTLIVVTVADHVLKYPKGYEFRGPLFDTINGAREHMALYAKVAMPGETIEIVTVPDSQ